MSFNKCINIIYLLQIYCILDIINLYLFIMAKKNTARKKVSKQAREGLKGMQVVFNEEKEKYSKAQYAQVYKGYDFLENLLTVRTFVQKKYDIDWPTLELLLKLMGMQIFTRAEYSKIPKDFGFSRFNSFKELGYINLLSDHYDIEKRLFTISTKGRNIVINFYKYLSGEKRIPENLSQNPMAKKKKDVAYDKKKMKMIKIMNQLPIPEHTKKLFS